MPDKSKLDPYQLIETEARKVPPLTHVLLLYAFFICPIWTSAVVVAIAEVVSAPLADNFYVAAYWTISGGMIVSLVITIFAGKQVVRRRVELTGDAGERSSCGVS